MKTIRPVAIFVIIAIIGCSALLSSKVTFHFNSHIDGFFILEGVGGKWLELTDDLTPEDASHLLWGMPNHLFNNSVASKKCNSATDSCIDYRWDNTIGRGFIRSTWSNGHKLVINLGRFTENNGKHPSGLFIGGGLPPSDPDFQLSNNDATGMTYYNGRRWFHVWCNANEGILSPSSPLHPSYPFEWQFKGSWILEDDSTSLTIRSRHRVNLAGVPLDLDRTLFYTNGSRYVILVTQISNEGTIPTTFEYLYGDEPWLGDFGSSAGDIGWTEKELIFTERSVDTGNNNFVGMFDYGNPLAGESHLFTGIANFIEWDKDERPNTAYLANTSGGIKPGSRPEPLKDPANRFVGLRWKSGTLKPGEAFTFTIAVGMAGKDLKTGLPIKPDTGLNR